MRKSPLLMPLLAVVLAGCGVELLTTTAIQGELQAQNIKAATSAVGKSANTIGKINIERAIDTFYAEKGRFPGTLNDLVPGYLPTLPTHSGGMPYGYDPIRGRLLDAPVSAPTATASGSTGNDAQKLNQIQAAIHRYGTTTGYYPPSLNALVPDYLAAVPKTDSGQDFLFDATTGALRNPSQGAAQPVHMAQPRGGAPAGGAGVGPMGEMMTGIGIQKQLNSMSNAGSNSAGTYMRGKAGRSTQQHNQQQEKALKDLGL